MPERGRRRTDSELEPDLSHISEALRSLAHPLSELSADPDNMRRHPDRNRETLRASLLRFGQRKPAVVRKDGMIVEAGNCLLDIAHELGWTHIAVVFEDDDAETARDYALVDNRSAELAEWADGLSDMLQQIANDDVPVADLGWSDDEMQDLLASIELSASNLPAAEIPAPKGALADRFVVPPFSVLDARQGYWKARKGVWLGLGIKSELGRGAAPDGDSRPSAGAGEGLQSGASSHAGLLYASQDRLNEIMGGEGMASGTSIFDPVLCEIAYRWFCPSGGSVLDPFAGGSVRGVVASKLGLRYTGIELRPEQVEANGAQASEILAETDPRPRWIEGDSRDMAKLLQEGDTYDLVFTCPPYYDLEVYCDDKRDLSNAESYADFMAGYKRVLRMAIERLRDRSFAVLVVGEIRRPDGAYRGFVSDTIRACEAAGARFYNEAILVTAIGSLPVRAGKIFTASRKLGKTHQNVLIFYKGDPAEIDEWTGGDSVDALATETVNGSGSADAYVDEQTPVQQAGEYWLKRDDLLRVAGVAGGKARTCWALAQGAPGLVTAGSRQSPQVNIVAHVAQRLGIPCQVHCPSGKLTDELLAARAAGADLVQHTPGHNSVIVARARTAAQEHGWTEIPFGMECDEAVRQTAAQVPVELPDGVRRIVVPELAPV